MKTPSPAALGGSAGPEHRRRLCPSVTYISEQGCLSVWGTSHGVDLLQPVNVGCSKTYRVTIWPDRPLTGLPAPGAPAASEDIAAVSHAFNVKL